MEVLRDANRVWSMSKLVAPHLRETSLIWKGGVGYLVPLYSPRHKRNKYAIWIIFDITFSSLSTEAAAAEAMWQRIWNGNGLTRLRGGS